MRQAPEQNLASVRRESNAWPQCWQSSRWTWPGLGRYFPELFVWALWNATEQGREQNRVRPEGTGWPQTVQRESVIPECNS